MPELVINPLNGEVFFYQYNTITGIDGQVFHKRCEDWERVPLKNILTTAQNWMQYPEFYSGAIYDKYDIVRYGQGRVTEGGITYSEAKIKSYEQDVHKLVITQIFTTADQATPKRKVWYGA